jgi:hypothetical protein
VLTKIDGVRMKRAPANPNAGKTWVPEHVIHHPAKYEDVWVPEVGHWITVYCGGGLFAFGHFLSRLPFSYR